MRNTRLAGHSLPTEGRLYDEHGLRKWVGPCHCSCGWFSPEVFVNDYQRRARHAEHKAAIAAGKEEPCG